MLSPTYVRCKLDVGFSGNMLERMLQIAASGEPDEEIEKRKRANVKAGGKYVRLWTPVGVQRRDGVCVRIRTCKLQLRIWKNASTQRKRREWESWQSILLHRESRITIDIIRVYTLFETSEMKNLSSSWCSYVMLGSCLKFCEPWEFKTRLWWCARDTKERREELKRQEKLRNSIITKEIEFT